MDPPLRRGLPHVQTSPSGVLLWNVMSKLASDACILYPLGNPSNSTLVEHPRTSGVDMVWCWCVCGEKEESRSW